MSNNPGNRIDPSGLLEFDVGCSVTVGCCVSLGPSVGLGLGAGVNGPGLASAGCGISAGCGFSICEGPSQPLFPPPPPTSPFGPADNCEPDSFDPFGPLPSPCSPFPITPFPPPPPTPPAPLCKPEDENCFGEPEVPEAVDPNEKLGATGFGAEAYILADTVIPYRINFENLGPGSVPTPTKPATAPAQRVEVTDQISANLDWDTLRFTEFGFGDTIVTVPYDLANHFETVSMTYNNRTFDVQVELSFDSAMGLVSAVFQSLDPGTALPPDVLTGFLPPEDGTGIGKAHVSFSIQPKAGLTSGTALAQRRSDPFRWPNLHRHQPGRPAKRRRRHRSQQGSPQYHRRRPADQQR